MKEHFSAELPRKSSCTVGIIVDKMPQVIVLNAWDETS